MTGLVSKLLEKRGIIIPADIDRFLQPNYERDTHSPFLLNDMERAVARIFAAMAAKERIAVYADFDCDGIPGAALLSDFFHKIGYGNFEVYLPHRDNEGYGFHTEAIDGLKSRNVSVIITVDVGTVAHVGIEHAKKQGIDVIVTDHHEMHPSTALGVNGEGAVPYALVNPKLANYPFPDLCGAAVAWKLVCALLIKGRRRGLKEFAAIPEGWEKWLLDLVAIATIADLVPLIGENRTLAHFGLTVLRKSPRPGIRTLVSQLRLRQSDLTEDDIAFSFAPRINAASRMGNPETAFNMLTATNERDAEALVSELETLNAKRKGVVAGMVREARKRMHARYTPEDRVVVLGDTSWKPSLAGLVANSLMEEQGGVVCIWGENGKGELKGSFRSDGTISVVELCSLAKDAFIEFGGHQASGGFSIERESAHALPETLKNAAAQLAGMITPKVTQEHDALIGLSEVSWPLFSDISRLAPFGVGNLKPVFRISRASVASMRVFGKQKNHVEVALSCFDTGARARAFDFFRQPDDFSFTPEAGASVDVIATLVRDSFRGREALALRISDILPSR